MTVVEYRDKFLTLSRYAPDETDTVDKRKERFLNGLHDEMQTVLVNIPFADLEALVDSAIQMEGKLHQANENRKRRMANQSGSSHPQRFRPSSSGGFTPRNNKPPMQNSRPGYQNRSGGNSKPGGYNNNNNNNHNYNRAPPRAPNNNNTNTAPRTGSNAVPVANKPDKATITCYECGVVGHYSNECPKRLAKLAGNTAHLLSSNAVSPPAKVRPNNPNNRNGRLPHERRGSPEAPDVVRNVHTHDRACTGTLQNAPGHVVAPPAPLPPAPALCAHGSMTTPAITRTHPLARGNPVHDAMIDAICHGRQGARTMTSATGPRFHRNHVLRHRQDIACTPCHRQSITAAVAPSSMVRSSMRPGHSRGYKRRPSRAQLSTPILLTSPFSSSSSTRHARLATAVQFDHRSPRRC
ncbi:hypothetical protein QYE76_003302 [Lolium multiflorum]|uniref:CCHC-type domain-containing protein n=1 Tax=Lolium multiflorum TaxID=4521 RepID=A0AAD8RQJ9_LOLMU|nr:hypothetical protein QYE76_003302 [Lolium multiflorum]